MQARFLLLAVAGVLWSYYGGPISAKGAAETVDFNRDVRPIFVNNCFKCHGPDAHNAQTDFRLYKKEKAFLDLGGYKAIVPGKPEKSRLYQRITAEDKSKRMPPPDSGSRLPKGQIETIRQWIEQGAEWERHWAFQPIKRPELPEVENEAWPKNGIDYFVLDRLEEEGLSPSKEADKRTLIRRASLDLTGLPPKPEQVDRFLADSSPDAYETAVDRFLDSPHYGEHMARSWLDAARYADTHGMHFDNKRSIWPYRDWVIEAFNDNMPFDKFTIDQLAGDLREDPTRDQLVATGFNRANITSNEGGSIPKELWTQYTIDRTSTMGTVWLGLTVGCAQCHDHKYDPIKQKEFYELYSFFYNMADKPLDGNAYLPPPTLQLPSDKQEQQLQEYDKQIAAVRDLIDKKVDAIDYQPSEEQGESKGRQAFVWIDDQLPEGANVKRDGSETEWQFLSNSEGPVLSGEKAATITTKKQGQFYFTGAKQKLQVGIGDILFAHVRIDPEDPPKEILLQFNDGSWEHRAAWGEDRIDYGKKGTPSRRLMGELPETDKWIRLEIPAQKVGLEPGSQIQGWAFTQYGGTVYWDKAGIMTRTPQEGMGFNSLIAWEQWQRENDDSSLPKDLRKIVKKPRQKRSDDEQQKLTDYFVEHAYSQARSEFKELHQRVKELKEKKQSLKDSIPGTMITRRKENPEPAHFLKRGEYDNPGQKVSPDVPDALPPLPKDVPRNRLGLAKWLVDERNPLTARVIVNRMWQEYFGKGLARSAENFGALGEYPTHPKLLDWLAAEFIASGWDVKHMNRLIATSATYRQSSEISRKLQNRDPKNKLLARGPHYRLDAEVIRDYALFVSGLLVDKVGGPPVNPYQPPGLWKAVAYEGSNTMNFERDEGEKLYRRSVYTFWKRTAPPPNMMAFDPPTREDCTVRRERTNTPSQALVLMNDVQFVEAARHLAQRILTEGGDSPERKVKFAFETVLMRPPDTKEKQIMLDLFNKQLSHFQGNPKAAKELIHEGASAPNLDLEPTRLAAWTMVGNAMLNLSETISKR